MRYVCLFGLILMVLCTPVLHAQDGAAIYRERCASCHDMPEGRVPALSTIKAMSGEAIFIALTSGSMKTQAEGMSTAQIFTLLGFIEPTGIAGEPPVLTRTCKTAAAFGAAAFKTAMNAPRWNGWSTSVTNSRFQDTRSAGLSRQDVPRLKLKWAFNLGSVTVARSQPAVVGGRVFIASQTGAVYSLDANSGCTHWGFRAAAPIRSGVTLGDSNGTPAIYFGDSSATVYALNAESGEVIWKIRPVDHFATMITAAPQVYKGVVYQSFSSIEELIGADASYSCCTFRGSVVALDAATGKKLWQTFTIPEEPKPTRKSPAGTQLLGPSGAGVWSTPTIDGNSGPCTSRPATTIRTHHPKPVMPSWRWTSRPGLSCGRANYWRTMPSLTDVLLPNS